MKFRWLVSVLAIAVCIFGVGCASVPGEDVGSNAGAATDTTAAKNAVSDLADSTTKKDEVDDRLGRAIGRVGSYLTAKQQADFARAFNALPDVQKIETDYRAKAKTLATELDKLESDPEAIATYGAKNLIAAYAAVAKTPEARSSLQFGTDVLAKRIVIDGVGSEEITDQIIAPSLACAYLNELVETGTVEGATKKTIGILETGTNVTMNIAGWLQRYNAFHETDVLAKSLGVTSDASVGALRTIAGLIAIWKLGDDIAEADASKLVQDFLAAAPTAVTGIASATALFRHAVMGIAETPMASVVIKWTGRIATGLGFITTGLALYHDAGKWNDSLDDKVRVMSDILAIGASILVLAGTGPIGPAVATVAMGLSFFADWLQSRRLAAQEQADVEACLPKAGMDAALAKTMLASDASLLKVLRTDVKLDAADLQWLLTVDPQVASTDAGMPLRFIGIRVTQKVFDLDSKETSELLHAALGEAHAEEGATQMDAFLRALDFNGIRGDMSREEALAWFDDGAVSEMLREPRKSLTATAAANARAYLANVN